MAADRLQVRHDRAPKTCAFMQRGVPARESRLVRARPQTGRLSQTTAQPVLNDGRECPKRRHSLSQTTAHSIAECPKRRHTQADFGPSPVLNDGTHIIYQSPSARGDPTPDIPPSPDKGEPGRPADEGEAAAPNALNVTTAAAPPAFDLIDGSFRIGDRRIVLCNPAADAMDLTAGLLAQQLATSHPSNSQAGSRATDGRRPLSACDQRNHSELSEMNAFVRACIATTPAAAQRLADDAPTPPECPCDHRRRTGAGRRPNRLASAYRNRRSRRHAGLPRRHARSSSPA